MNLNKLHTSVKKLDALLTQRETGTTFWWIMLGNLVREINDIVFPDQPEDIEIKASPKCVCNSYQLENYGCRCDASR